MRLGSISRCPFIESFALAILLASTILAGCSEDEPNRTGQWELVDADTLTGFYVGKTEGGLLTIRVEHYEYLAPQSPATPPLVPPIEVHGTLFPDDADTVIHLTGGILGSHFTMQGPGYYFSGTYSDLTFGGAFSSLADTGYFGGYVGTMDSVQVYCGSFTGDSLQGHWHFAVRAPVLRGAGVASDTSVTLGYDGTVSGPGPTGSVTFAGTANGVLTLQGEGTLSSESGSGTWLLSGGFDAGTWTADRMRVDSTAAALAQELANGARKE